MSDIFSKWNFCVLHLALQPLTGPWSVMRELAHGQQKNGLYAGVGIGVITDESWPKSYQAELEAEEFYYQAKVPKLFGTAAFLLQIWKRPPILKWIEDMAGRCRVSTVIVHCHNAWLSGVFLPLEHKSLTIRFVATFHGVNTIFAKQPLRKIIHRWMAQRLPRYGARLTSVDADNLARAAELFGLSENLFTVIANGLSTHDIPREHSIPCLRGENILTIAHIGALLPQKGWEIAARGVLKAGRLGSRCRLLIAGFGPDEDRARQLAAENPGVIDYLGYVSMPRLNLLPNIDILALLSMHEGLPMAIIEALSMGIPVIATPVGGIPEAVIHEKNGLLIERSEQAFCKAVQFLTENREILHKFSKQSKEIFQEKFTIDKIVTKYHGVYEQE